MKLAVLADTPDPAILQMVKDADVLITLGDLHPAEVPTVQIPHLFVYGNHDSPHQPFERRPLRHDLHLMVIRIGGVYFGGFQGSRRYKPKGHYLYDDDEVADLLKGFPAVDVFLAHAPITELGIDDGIHDGFGAFDAYIRRTRPGLFLCGHVHRNRKIVIGPTRCMSVYAAQMVRT
jgi:Icc-related predicted phosphoesterase